MTVETAYRSPSVRSLAPSFRRHLLAGNRSPNTVRAYMAAVDGLVNYFDTTGMPSRAAAIRREHVESYLIERMAHVKASSVHVARSEGRARAHDRRVSGQ